MFFRMVSSHNYLEGDILGAVWVVSSDGENIGRLTHLKMGLDVILGGNQAVDV